MEHASLKAFKHSASLHHYKAAATTPIFTDKSGSKMGSDSGPEPPFVSRDRILKYQKYFQSVKKPTYLKGKYDFKTSVTIPIILASTSMYLVARGLYNMAHGIGKKK